MPHSLLVDVLGLPVRIDLSAAPDAARDRVYDAWSGAALVSGALGDRPDTIPTITMRDMPHADALSHLSQDVTLAGIRQRRGALWMLHAAGVAASDGRVLVFIGPSGRGKTTASLALGRRFSYVSDETVGISAEGDVVAHRKPLSIIESPGEPKVQRSPSDCGLLPLPDAPLRLAGVVLLDRRMDAPERPLLETVDLGVALGDIVPQCSYLSDLAAPLATIDRLVEATGGVKRLSYREAEQLPDVARDIFDEAPLTISVEPAATELGELASSPDARGTVGESEPRYWREPFVDALSLTATDRLAILQGTPGGAGTLRVLGGVAPAIWLGATGATVSDLVAAAVEEYGAPEGVDAGSYVETAATELVEAGLLRRYSH